MPARFGRCAPELSFSHPLPLARCDGVRMNTPVDSCPECVTKALDRAIERCVNVRRGHAYPDGSRRLESNRHGARDRLASPTVISLTKHNPHAAELPSVTRQC